MKKAIPSSRNITNYLLGNPKSPLESWRLKSSIGDIKGVFHIIFNSSEHHAYKLRVELDIFPDGNAYFFEKEEGRQEQLEEILNNSIKSVVKKSWVKLRKSGLVVYIPNDKNKERNDNLFSVVEKIIEFVANNDVVRSIDINLSKKFDKNL